MKEKLLHFLTPGRPVSKAHATLNRWLVFLIVIASFLMDNFSTSAVLACLQEIQYMFNVPSSVATWVFSAYALTLGSFIIFFGKVSDIFGAHVVCVYGLIFMSIFSLLIATIHTNIISACVFRALQGIGGSAIVPCAYTVVATYFEGEQFHRGIIVFSVVGCGGFGIGFVLGGALGYVNFFYFSFAYSATCAIILYFFIIPVENPSNHVPSKMRNLNYPVVLLLIGSLASVIYAFIEASNSWNSPKVYVPLSIGIVTFFLIFLFENVFVGNYQQKHPRTKENENSWLAQVDPFFPIEAFKVPNFNQIFFGLCLLYISFVSILYTFIQYFQVMKNDSPLMAGVKLVAYPVGMITCAVTTNDKFFQWLGYKYSLIITTFISIGGAIWLVKIDYKLANEYWIINLGGLFLSGFACNFYFKIYMTCIMSSTPPALHGTVTGIFQTGAQVATSLASSISSTILGNIDHVEDLDKLMKKFTNVMYLNLTANILWLVCILFYKNQENEILSNSDPENNSSSDLEPYVGNSFQKSNSFEKKI